jgi:hypothetical protein
MVIWQSYRMISQRQTTVRADFRLRFTQISTPMTVELMVYGLERPLMSLTVGTFRATLIANFTLVRDNSPTTLTSIVDLRVIEPVITGLTNRTTINVHGL